MKKAEIYLKQGKFTETESLYQQVIADHGDGILADDAQFLLAELYENQMKDKSKA